MAIENTSGETEKMKKKSFQQIILVIFFIIGGLIFTYPFYSNGINYLVDHYRLKEMEQRTEEEEQVRKKKMAEENNQIQVKGLVVDHDPFDASQVNTTKVNLKSHLIGSVSIPTIDMTVPLFDTLTNDILENGAGVLQGTSMPTGGIGNHSVISAHRGLAERLLFRNLDKLEKGDVFLVDSLGDTLAYEVTTIQTVKPEETDFIKLQPEEDLVSLLTCTPYMINSHRLIVTGKRTDVTDVIKKTVDDSHKREKWQQIAILSGIIIGCLFLLWLLIRGIKNYLLSRKTFHFSFYLQDSQSKPISSQKFLIYRKGNKQPLRRNGQLLVVKSQDNGRVKIKDLPGGIYQLGLKKDSQAILGSFGVKQLKDSKMGWLKTNIASLEVSQRKHIYLKLDTNKKL